MSVRPPKIRFREYYALLAEYLRPQRGRVMLLAGLILGSIGIQLVNPQIMRFFIDTAVSGGSQRILVLAAVGFIIAAVLQQAMSVAATYAGENVAWSATNALKEDLLRHCLNLDMAFHKLHTPGEMIERLDEDPTSLANFFSQFSIRVFGNLLIIAGVLLLLYREDWRVGLAMTIFVCLTLLVLQLSRTVALTAHREASQANAELSGFIEERLAGTEDIRANGAEPHVMRGLYRFMRHRSRKQLRSNVMGVVLQMSAIGMHAIGLCLSLTAGVMLMRAGRLTIGAVYLFVAYTDLIYRPVMQITRQMEDFQRATAGLQRIQEIWRAHSTILDGNGPNLPPGPLAVACEEVSFRYEPDEEMVLREISLALPPGQTLGLLGRTGSGKTTLTRLLARLYEPENGRLQLGGVDLRSSRLSEVRRRVGLVTQDVQIFHASVRDNVTFFDKDVSDTRIEEVLDELGLRGWFSSLPKGLDTILNMGGTGLSAGEAQLLAMSRVFLRDPGLVILDEASSRLDPATESLLERAVDRLLTGRTGVIVAHRLRTVERVDQIMILENGRIIEYGARERLLADSSSVFRRLLATGLEEVMA